MSGAKILEQVASRSQNTINVNRSENTVNETQSIKSNEQSKTSVQTVESRKTVQESDTSVQTVESTTKQEESATSVQTVTSWPKESSKTVAISASDLDDSREEVQKRSSLFQATTLKLQKSASFKQSPPTSEITLEDDDDKVWLEPRSGGNSFGHHSRPASFGAAGLYGERSASMVGRSMIRDYVPVGRTSQSYKNPLDNLSDKELVTAVQDLQKNTRHYELENMVFLHFLQQNDPSLVEDMDLSLKTAQTMHERASISSKRLTLTRHSRRESFFFSPSMSSIAGGAMLGTEKEGPKINITQKTDLILREMDEIQDSCQKLLKKCGIMKHKLKAELEEMSIRETEIRQTMDTFESVFVNGTLEKYTQQKNPADKFARFMEECFRESRKIIDKLRLRSSSLRVQYHKICNQLTQKKLLGENLQEVDFEQLQIENKRLIEKIDKRNLLLLELKRMNGHANLLLSRTKKNLLGKLDNLKEIQETITFREDLIGKLDDECDKVATELENTKSDYDKIKSKSENYQVPPVIDYVKKKAELATLKKNLRIWSRRKQIKEMALMASVREMKHVTGLKTPRTSWFEMHDSYKRSDSLDGSYEFMFESKAKEKRRARMIKRMKSRRFKD